MLIFHFLLMYLLRGGHFRYLINLPPSSSSDLFSWLTNRSIPPTPSIVRHFSPGRYRSDCCRSFSTRQRKDFYKVLDVPKSASQADIKKAYYTLSKKYHPDVTGSNESCAQKYLEVKEAYEILRDEKLRAEHDRWLGAEEVHRQRTVDGQHPFEGERKVHTEWRPYNGTSVEEELQRIWRSMNGNGEFRQANRDFEAAMRRNRQMAYEHHMRRRNGRMKNGFRSDTDKRGGDWTEQDPLKTVAKIVLIYLLIAFLIEILSSFIEHLQRTMIPQTGHMDEETRRWIEEWVRRRP